MKVLRISGKNLASFASFELDLSTGTLGGAALFAITGKTGSGKSTLLDAVCLALYGELPRAERVPQSGRLEIGEDHYETGQAVSVVRRGTSEASATCDFVASDGQHYRSCWSARAIKRGENAGRMQEDTPKLYALDGNGQTIGKALNDKRGDHRATVLAKVGLTADEFRRAVLLAQDDFATFLRSRPGDRAALLAKITGAVAYAGIGAKVKELRLAKMTEEAAAGRTAATHTPWTDEAESVAGAALEKATRELDEAREAEMQLAAETRLREERTARHLALSNATAAVLEAQGAVAAAEPKREQLRLADLAEPARSVVDAFDLAVYADRAARSASEERTAAVVVAEARLTASTQEEADKQRAFADHQDRAKAAEPALAEARRRDDELRALGAAASAAAEKVQAAEHARDARRLARQHAEGLAATCRTQHAEAEQYLAAHAAVGESIRNGDPVLAVQANRAAASAASQRRLQFEQCDADARRAELAAESALGALVRAKAEATAAAEALATLGDRPDLEATLAAERSARAALDAGRLVSERTVAHEAATAALDTRLAQTNAVASGLSDTRAEMDPAETAQEEARHDLTAAEKLLAKTRDRLSLAGHRAELTPDEPCPLCGAKEHPWAADGPPEANIADEVVREARAGWLRASEVVATLRARAVELAEQHRLLEAVLPRLRAEAEGATDALVSARSAWGSEPVPSDGDLLAAANTATEHAKSVGQARERWDECQRTCTSADGRVHAAIGALVPLAERFSAARARSEAARAEAADAEIAAEGARHAALGAVAGWSPPPDLGDASGAVAAVTEAVGAWRLCEQQFTALAARLPGVEAAEALAREEHKVAEDTLSAATTAWTALSADQNAARAARAQLLAGRAVAEVEQEHQDRLEGAARDVAAAQTARAAASARRESATSELQAAVAQAGRCEGALATALAACHRATQPLGWTLEELRPRLLAHTEREHIRAVLQDLVAKLALSEASRAQAVAEVAALPPPPAGDPESLAARVSEAAIHTASAVRAQNEAFANAANGRREGERRRAADAEYERLRALAEPWRELYDVIGGDRFQRHAQEYSIVNLVELANEQLALFAPRYTLHQHPSEGLELLVCDQDGGELRGTESLSGGETFLVSLALALALGRISARSVNVQTLFIDEGFGTLDSESVEPVVDALRLISARGTQIGVISHVPVVAEKVDARVMVIKTSETSRLSPPSPITGGQ